MRARILVGLIGAPALFGVIWGGFPYLTILVALAALWGMYEFNGLARGTGAVTALAPGMLLTLLFVLNGQLAEDQASAVPFLIAASFGVPLLWNAVQPGRSVRGFVRNWLLAAAGPLYVGLLLSHALMLREAGDLLYDGRNWLLFAVFTTFATDSGAYFVGKGVGRHRMAPSISPAKTWEGAAGGLAGAVGVAVAVRAIFDLEAGVLEVALLGLGLGVAAQVGDLVESVLKRRAGAKDAGALIPGHGGLLDRMDSLLVTIPVTYYSMALIID